MGCPQSPLAGGQPENQTHQVLLLAPAAVEPVLAAGRSRA
ncbi:hypothetical protein FLM9_70 [Candidatus Synechococcus spongiarum]|uniref:Uncharacterized protein n=1 Tax=Candidatus Synechococcus spongiarum TaxID=431041 RepID=A0A170T3L9_9SYNE|nr:hypothetical protein FLM9_70 [Candidatus Synechococcus spongiarum]